MTQVIIVKSDDPKRLQQNKRIVEQVKAACLAEGIVPIVVNSLDEIPGRAQTQIDKAFQRVKEALAAYDELETTQVEESSTSRQRNKS